MANKIIGKVAMTPKGEWSATTKYAILDVVTKNDIMYVAIKDVPLGTVVTNTTYWIKLISGSGVVFDTAMSDTSENGVQNKVIKAYVDNGLGNKVDKVSGKGLSTNDYTTNEKTKLSGIETGANKTTVDSAMSSTSTNPIQNKVVNTALGNKVDKVDGKGLSTNDYTTTDKTAVGTIGNKVDKVSGKGLSTNDYTDDDKTLVGTISSKADSNNPVFTGTVTIPAQSLDCSVDGSKEVYDGGVYFTKHGNIINPNPTDGSYFCVCTEDSANIRMYYKSGDIVTDGTVTSSNTHYKANDTLTFGGYTFIASGYISNGSKELIFTVVTPKSLANINTISCTQFKGATVRGVGGYIQRPNATSGTEYNWSDDSTCSVTCNKTSDNSFRVKISTTSSYKGTFTNNTPICVQVGNNCTFKFT